MADGRQAGSREIGVCIFTMNRYSKNFIAQLDSRTANRSLICDDKDEFICIAIIIGRDGRYTYIYMYIYISSYLYVSFALSRSTYHHQDFHFYGGPDSMVYADDNQNG